MKATHNLLALAAATFMSLSGASFAQNAMPGHNMNAMGSMAPAADQATLPDICITEAGQAHAASMPPMSMGSMQMDQGHMDLMAGMDEMHKAMMTGTMAEDIDVAFVCGMIPHHQGAINMAKAELANGDDEWAKEMAQKVIDAQEQEISEMMDWLAKQSK